MKYKIIVDKQSSANPSTEKKEYEIDIEELRVKGDVYDSLVITKDEDYVMRRLSLSEYQVLSVLEEPVKEPLKDLNIQLFEGDNYIYLMDMQGNKFYAEYIVKNDFTDIYVTKNEMNSSINQSATQIELSVNQKLTGYSTTQEMNSAINLKADSIISQVNNKLTNYDTSQEVTSKIEQKADSITSTVNNTLKNYSTTTQMNSAITQKANEITSTVSSTYATKTELNTAKSEIKQTTDSISSTVSKKVGNDEIISKINQSAEAVSINAGKVDLSGYVTISNIKTAGKTTINGSNITTGTIDASKATITNINADNIKSGTISGRAISGGTITGTKITNGSNFSVDASGNMTCKNGNFSGTISGSTINLTDNGGSSSNLNLSSSYGNSSISSTWIQVKNSSGSYVSIQDGQEIVVTDAVGNTSTIYPDSILTMYSSGAFARLVPGSGVSTGSKEEFKKNISLFSNGKEIVEDSQIYLFNLKTEEDNEKKHIGFVIGENYKTPKEVISKTNDGIDLYSMISIAWKAIQELIQENENLQQRIEKLEAK